MALWGTADAKFATGTISVDLSNSTITGSGTTFLNLQVGDVISIGVGNTYGEAIISGVTSNTFISIASTQSIVPNAGHPIAGVAYTVSEKPLYTLHDSLYNRAATTPAKQVFGIDQFEVGVAGTTRFAVSHAGWVGIQTYNDMHQTLRFKSEVLVATSGISTGVTLAGTVGDEATTTKFGDAADDAFLTAEDGTGLFTP